MAGEPQVQQGSQGEWVTYLQQILELEGIDTGPVDGIFGPITWGRLRASADSLVDAAVDEAEEQLEQLAREIEAEVAEIDARADEDAGGSESGDDDDGTTRESVTVEHTLTYVEQSDDETCWAASTAMMLGRTDDREIVREVTGDDPSDDENDAVSEVELARVANHYGFSQVYPVCQDAFGWADWLAQGPLLIQVPGQTHHSVVAAGVYASADENVEESLLLIYDPWPGNGVRWLSFNDANNDYEMAGENWSNNVYRR